ncbi:MAG: N-acetyl-gamma-glutamyl-phosphate reductase [Candidatus Methylomirabilia bacterium]
MIRIAVAGASGYMGAELLRLLFAHPEVQVTAVTSARLAGEPLERLFPHLRALSQLTFKELNPERLAQEAEVVFLALPHMESQKVVPVLRRNGRKVIDLSADYRLKDAQAYDAWYTSPHSDPEGLAEAAYGLPELHRKAIAGASLVASAGCYPVGAVLAIAPLLKQGVGRAEGIVIDSKSGVTGAGAQGRNVNPMYLYPEMNENIQAYSVAAHRHTPEIEQELSALAGQPVRVSFTPHLVPLNRGLFTAAYVPLATSAETDDILALYREFYTGEPFVRVLPIGALPSTRAVMGSNLCDVAVVVDARTNRAICLSAIDNLGKGGAANGVQTLNLMMGWDERTGLGGPPVFP